MKPTVECPFGEVRCLCRTCVKTAAYEGCDHGYCIGCFECMDDPAEQRHDVYICTGHEELKEEE